MASWIPFALIHTKAVLLNQSKKGSYMTQSQNAIFTSPKGKENLMNGNHRDLESIADVCSNGDLPEVKLVNLLEEQLLQYKLRVDSLLYKNQDGVQSPLSHSMHLIPSPQCLLKGLSDT